MTGCAIPSLISTVFGSDQTVSRRRCPLLLLAWRRSDDMGEEDEMEMTNRDATTTTTVAVTQAIRVEYFMSFLCEEVKREVTQHHSRSSQNRVGDTQV